MITASIIYCINCGIGSDAPHNGNGSIRMAYIDSFDSCDLMVEARQRCRLQV
jgi:hypothetical protein